MALCSFSSELVMDNYTIIDNIFINDYLPSAPEYCVKVYLYGLSLCSNPKSADNALDSMAKVLHLTEQELQDAFLYWQNAGLVLYMTQFYRLWNKIEQSYRGDIACRAADGKYSRKLVLKGTDRELREVDVGHVIAAYIDAFDRALKTFFYHLKTPSVAAAGVEEIYRRYILENQVWI